MDAVSRNHARLSAQLHFCTAIRVSGKIMRQRPIDEVVEEISGATSNAFSSPMIISA